MSKAREYDAESRSAIEEARHDVCELCGRRTATEVHHIVPVMCGGSSRRENLISLCKACHSLLTPSGELSRIGIRHAKEDNVRAILRTSIREAFFAAVRELEDNHLIQPSAAEDMLDIFDGVYAVWCKLWDMDTDSILKSVRYSSCVKQIGQAKGAKLTTKKSIRCKEIIRAHSKDFGGTLSDIEVMKLTGLARGTFYKYKRELRRTHEVRADADQ